MVDGVVPASYEMKILGNAWKSIRTKENTLDVARLKVEADLRKKAAENTPLTRKEKVVAAILGGEAKFGFGAAPAARAAASAGQGGTAAAAGPVGGIGTGNGPPTAPG